MAISPTTVRANGSTLSGYLAIFRGALVLEATVTANPVALSAVSLSISIDSGSIAAVMRGYRVQLFADDGVTFKGETHVRWSGTLDSTHLPLREWSQSEFLILTNDIVRVYALMSFEDKLVENTDLFNPDGQPIGTYNSAPPPLACSGGYDAGFVDGYGTASPLTYRTTLTNGAPSMVLDPSSSPSALAHLWTLPSGVAFAAGSANTDVSPTLEVDVGEYTVFHEVTDTDNSQTWRQCVTYSVYDGVTRSPVPVIMENAPNGTPESGWGCSFRAIHFLNLTDAPDGSLVLFFVREQINGTTQSLGGTVGRSAIKLAGYLSTDESDLTPQLNYQRFDVISPLLRLGQLPGFSKLLIQSVTPDEWSKLGSLTTLRAIIQLLRMYTFVLDGGHDLLVSALALDLPYPELWLQKETPVQQVNELADGVDARFVCLRGGLFRLGPQLPLLPPAQRSSLPLQYTFEPTDVARMVLRRNHFDTVETLELHATGATASGVIANVPPVFSRAPGSPGHGAEFITIERVIASVSAPQTNANQRAGRRYAQRNGVDTSSIDGAKARLIELDVELRQVYDFLDFTDDVVHFDGFSNPRGLDLSLYDWALTRAQLDYLSGKVLYSFAMLTDSPAGATYVPPPSPTPPVTIPFPPAIGVGTPSDDLLYGLPSSIGNIALFDSGANGYWTGDLRAAAPDWVFTDLSSAPTWSGTLVMFIQDAFAPSGGVLISTTHKFQLLDFGNTPVLANDDAFRYTSAYRSMQSGRGQNGFFAVASHQDDGRIDLDVTLDSGATWTNYPDIGGIWVGGSGDLFYPGCYVYEHAVNSALFSAYIGSGSTAVGQLRGTTNAGAATSPFDGNTLLGASAGDITSPYQSGDSYFLHGGGQNGGGFVEYHTYRTTAAGARTDISPVVSSEPYGPVNAFAVKACDVDFRSILLVGTNRDSGTIRFGVFLSRDDGATWQVLVTPDTGVVWRAGSFAGDSPNVIFLWGIAGAFAVSYDGGASFQDKTVPSGLGPGTIVNIAGYTPA